MNLSVADPEWGWWIVCYFFLGGIAAGAYVTSTLIELAGGKEDAELARVGYGIAFPLVCVCGILLILDLNQPLRFWHMLLKSEVVDAALAEGWPWSGRSWQLMAHAASFKYWSPMSVGSWALLLFGLCSSLSFLGSLWPQGRLARRLRHGIVDRLLQLSGSAVGFFVAAYTGALLTATNQPVWSDSIWIASLFLASSASTGIALMTLVAYWRRAISEPARWKLERADLYVVSLELVVFVIFLISIHELLAPVFSVWAGRLLIVVAAMLGIVVPPALQFSLRLARKRGRGGRWQAVAASIIALLGGFVLRYAILATPPALLATRPEEPPASPQTVGTPTGRLPAFGPEDGRAAGEPGADTGNHVGEVRPRSKMLGEE